MFGESHWLPFSATPFLLLSPLCCPPLLHDVLSILCINAFALPQNPYASMPRTLPHFLCIAYTLKHEVLSCLSSCLQTLAELTSGGGHRPHCRALSSESGRRVDQPFILALSHSIIDRRRRRSEETGAMKPSTLLSTPSTSETQVRRVMWPCFHFDDQPRTLSASKLMTCCVLKRLSFKAGTVGLTTLYDVSFSDSSQFALLRSSPS